MTAIRRLAAILAADVAGYSRLIGADEEGTLDRLRSIRAEVIDPKITEHRGRIVKTTGDGLLVEFSSVVDALRCATEWQRGMAERNADVLLTSRIEFRMGVNVGDVVVEDGDIFGDGVNVAARLEGMADPGGICVSARVQEDAAGRLDLSFDDLGEQSLKNIARSVRVYRIRLATAEIAPTVSTVETTAALALPDKPSIAVLPFTNMSGDSEQEYFADGMVEEIITTLSRIRWLFVIARNSTFTYKGQAIDVKLVGRELGVRYVLEGSVRKAGGRVRITAQLIDAQSGTHLWADRFDGALEDVFELQDKVAISVAGAIEPTLQAAEIRRSADRPTNDLTAYDYYLRALAHWDSRDRDQSALALALLDQAIECDPDYAPALALAAHCRCQRILYGWSEDQNPNRRVAIDLVRRALQSADVDPDVLASAAYVLGAFNEDVGAASSLMERCLTLNPSFARGWYWSGVLRLFAGQPDVAVEHFKASQRLNPRDRVAGYLTGIGSADFFNRQFDDAAAKLRASLEQLPTLVVTHRILAACYAHMGRVDDAREIIARLKAITPVVIPSLAQFRNPDHRELLLSGLRLAAGEST
jgi:TolB-like protein/class 3 adenylate cyclase